MTMPRICLGLVTILILPLGPASSAGRLWWPDRTIDVPPAVRSFIYAECVDHTPGSAADIGDCINAEMAGYRATVEMLNDPVLGMEAAERYRACAAGLGTVGGGFHRRRAQCIGGSLGIKWRFETAGKA